MADADGPAGKRRRVDNHVADAAVACGIAVGSQLEVQWDLASDDGGTEQKWWETSILAKDGTTQLEKDNAEDAHAANGGGAIEHGDEDLPATHAQCYTLQYVADRALGWGDEEPEDLRNRSYFLDDHMLFDLDFGGILYYRLKGSGWEPTPTAAAAEAGAERATTGGRGTHTSLPNGSSDGGGGGSGGSASAPHSMSGTMGSPTKAKRAAEAMVGDVVNELVASQGHHLSAMDRTTAIAIASAVVAAKKAAEKAVAQSLQQSPGRARALSVDDCQASLEKEGSV